MIAGRIERLEELIAVHEEIAGEEAIELADAASFDPGPEAERLRRFQAAKSRELRQTLELFLKMQAAREKRKTFTTEGTEGTEEEDDGIRNARTKPIPGGTNGRPSPRKARKTRKEENGGIRNARTKPIPGAGGKG